MSKFKVFVLASLSFFLLVACRSDEEFLRIRTDSSTLKLDIEVALTDDQKRIGLMQRKHLPENYGMLFPYDEPAKPTMWMRNMIIPIDIIFIGEDLKINHIEKEAPPCVEEDSKLCERYRSEDPVLYVLELPSGYTEKHGVQLGDEILLPSVFQRP